MVGSRSARVPGAVRGSRRSACGMAAMVAVALLLPQVSSSMMIYPAAGPTGCAAARSVTRPAVHARALLSSRVTMLVPPVEYGPEMHPEQLAAMGLVTVMTAAGYVLWDRVLVPQKRLELSLSKKKGSVKALLDELDQQAPTERTLERWFFSDWIDARSGSPQKKKAAIPFLPKAKFNSGDNPVIGAVAAIMFIGVLSCSVKEVARVVMAAISQHAQ
ncbi:hypothetical protein T492DRAFT_1055232 [Pavlovales sp. CCMP2436]|nr:hypothetical protein T492DRAFT_1055232 [Pavlovales sp. CCMP2436]